MVLKPPHNEIINCDSTADDSINIFMWMMDLLKSYYERDNNEKLHTETVGVD